MELDPINTSTFSRLIRTLLLTHNRVSLPGMGSFIVEDQPSKLLENGRVISAPTRVVSFSVKEIWNDELLERAYASELEGAMLELEDGDDLTREELDEKNRHTLKLFLDQAKREIRQFAVEVERHLQNGKAFPFPGLGVMKMGKKRLEVTFEKDANCDLSPQEFGLEPLPIKPLATPSRLVEPVTPSTSSNNPTITSRLDEPKPELKPKPRPKPKPLKSAKKLRLTHFLLLILLFLVVLLMLVYIFRDVPWIKEILIKILYLPADQPWV